jgi:hypothetical protein
MLAGQHPGEFHPADLLFQLRQQFTHLGQSFLVVPFFSQFSQDHQVFQLPAGLFEALDSLMQNGAFLEQLLRLVALVPEAGAGYFGFELLYALFLGIEVKDTSSAH